jgi:hypothetical protein
MFHMIVTRLDLNDIRNNTLFLFYYYYNLLLEYGSIKFNNIDLPQL